MEQPQQYITVICSSCGLDWEKHVKLATKTVHDPTNQNGTWERVEVGPVTFEHCVTLLKKVNQGPAGPPGPTGASGPQGSCMCMNRY